MEGYPGARQSEIGYFSTVNNYEKYLDPKLVKEVYGGEGRDGGSLADPAIVKRFAIALGAVWCGAGANAQTLPKVAMPNRDGFIAFSRGK